MSTEQAVIVFIDNSIHKIFRTLDSFRSSFANIKAFTDEREALDFVYEKPTDLLFLNLDLLPHDAVSLTREIRQRKPESNPFIVIYSDKQDDFVQEMVFNCGADSFINFHNKPAILQLFIRNLLKRRAKLGSVDKRTIYIDYDQYLIFKNGEPIQLPKKEFQVFELLYGNPNKFFSKTEIAIAVWSDERIATKRIIDVHIYNIRQLFGKRVIQSQKNKGYRINKRFI
ncbi:MAG: two component transcriptional regulator, winged helix family [Bacteroidetes bacterium]|nr:two component transcriptional regulator, winged helix family [Bacteroidota bacterium]